MKKQIGLTVMGLLVFSFSLGCPVGLGVKKIANVQDLQSIIAEIKTNIIKEFKASDSATQSDNTNGLINISQTLSSAAMQQSIMAPAPTMPMYSDGSGTYMPMPSSSPPPKIRLFSYIEQNPLPDFLKLLFPTKKKGLQITGEYSYPAYLPKGEKGSTTFITDTNDILKSIIVKNSSGKELGKLDYSIMDNPASPKGAKAEDAIKGCNLKVWALDTLSNKELSAQGNISIAGQFDEASHFFKSLSALQCNLGGTYDGKTSNIELITNNFTPSSSAEATNSGVPPFTPGYLDIKATGPSEQIISKINCSYKYDWTNTKNMDVTMETVLNKQEWKITATVYNYSAKQVASDGGYQYTTTTFDSVTARLENITKNFAITIEATPPQNSGDELKFKGELISGAQKLGDIVLKETTCGTMSYASSTTTVSPSKDVSTNNSYGTTPIKCKMPFIVYTDGTEEDLQKYFTEIAEAIYGRPLNQSVNMSQSVSQTVNIEAPATPPPLK